MCYAAPSATQMCKRLCTRRRRGGFLAAAHTTDTRDKPKRYATKPNLKAAHRRSRRAPNGHRTPAAATSGYAEDVGYSDRKKARWGKWTNSRQ